MLCEHDIFKLGTTAAETPTEIQLIQFSPLVSDASIPPTSKTVSLYTPSLKSLHPKQK